MKHPWDVKLKIYLWCHLQNKNQKPLFPEKQDFMKVETCKHQDI